jgi:hypothetical protein
LASISSQSFIVATNNLNAFPWLPGDKGIW